MAREATAYFDDEKASFTIGGLTCPLEDGRGPYEYLMGALSGCFSFTLQDELEAVGITGCVLNVHTFGEKRESVPTTLRKTTIEMKISGADVAKKDVILSCVEKTKEHCSMYQTIKCVSDMNVKVEFDEP